MKANKKYLVAGRGGVGKSSVNQELGRRGRSSLDGDSKELGLAAWRILETGQPVTVDDPDEVDTSKIDWAWDPARPEEILSNPGELFLCGSAENDLNFFNKFSRVFVLTLDPATHLARLQTRPDNYGKDEAKQAEILAWQAQFVKDALALGATAIDAANPVEVVVDEILSLVNENS